MCGDVNLYCVTNQSRLFKIAFMGCYLFFNVSQNTITDVFILKVAC